MRVLNNERDLNHPATIAGAIGVMVMAPMFFLLLPIYVGALADDFGLSNSEIGNLILTELAGSAIASLTALYWLRRVNWRSTLLILLIVLVSCNALCVAVVAIGSSMVMLLVRFAAGFVAGALMAIAIAAVGDTDNQDRNFGLAVVAQLAVSGLLLIILPAIVVRAGVNAIFVAFLLAAAVAIPFAIQVPAGGKVTPWSAAASSRSWRALWGLAGTSAFFLAQSAVWAFMERMGVAAGIDTRTISLALGGSVVAGILGALAASWAAARFGRLAPMLVAMLGEVVCLAFLLDSFSVTAYVTVIVVYSICWNLWAPYQMAAVADADSSGRFVALITFSQALGIAVGPALVAPWLGESNYNAALWTGIGFAIVAMALFLPLVCNRSASITPTQSTQT